AEIDRIIRVRTGGSISSVSHPRQKLEELFMDIVRTAQAERAATSGATSEGQTAAFLREQPEASEDVIGRLVGAGDEPPARIEAAPEPEAPGARQPEAEDEEAPEEFLESLLEDDEEQPGAG